MTLAADAALADAATTSGQGRATVVPPEIDRWNWGAFLLNWIWGMGNRTFVALLMFVPLVNLVMMFVLGAKGSAWAWRNKRWASVEDFRAVQRKWAFWGAVVWVAWIAVLAAVVLVVMQTMRNSQPYLQGAALLQSSPVVRETTGQPVTTGLPTGSFETTGPSGRAELKFGVHGPKGDGTAYVLALQRLGEWRLVRVVFERGSDGRRTELLPEPPSDT